MADYLTNTTELTSIADAIRTKGGTSDALVFPTGFVSAIENIPTGGGVTTTHIYAYCASTSAYYTDANMTVQRPQIDYEVGAVTINDDAPIGSLVVCYEIPGGLTDTVGLTLLYGNMTTATYIYEVTG